MNASNCRQKLSRCGPCLWPLLIPALLSVLPAQAEQRLEMEGTAIFGNKESPNILYVVPWRKPDGISPMGAPTIGRDTGLLAPLDRDEFRRQIDWHQTFRVKP